MNAKACEKLVKQYLASKREEGVVPASVELYRQSLSRFVDVLTIYKLDMTDPRALAAFYKQEVMRTSLSAAGGEMYHLNTFLRYQDDPTLTGLADLANALGELEWQIHYAAEGRVAGKDFKCEKSWLLDALNRRTPRKIKSLAVALPVVAVEVV